MSKQQFLAENQLEGEIYAGLILGKNGDPDYHLFLRPEKPEKLMKWKEAMAWAESISHGLPTRREQGLLFANCQDDFEKKWYWSSESAAPTHYGVWMQDFENGEQMPSYWSTKHHTRAVRRVYLQEAA